MKKSKILFRIFFFSLIGLAFFYGVLVGFYQFFPFQQLKEIKLEIFPSEQSHFNEIPKLLEEASILFKDQKFEEALNAYENLIGMDPGNPNAISGLLRCLVQLKKYQEAKEILDSLDDETIKNDEISKITELVSSIKGCKVIDNDTLEFGDYRIKRQNQNVPFAVRDGAGALFYEEKLYLIGGWNPLDKYNFPLTTSNDVWVSSNDGISWHLIKPNTFNDSIILGGGDWKGRHLAGYVVHNNEMYIIGGDASQGYHINDIWKSSDGKNWELVNSNPPFAPRALHLSFVYRGFIYIIGGQTMPKYVKDNIDEIYYRDIWRSKDGIDWQKVTVKSDFFTPRGGYGGSGFVLNDEVYVIGGFTYENIVNKQRDIWTDVWKSSGDLSHWMKVGKLPTDINYNGLMFHDTAIFDNKLWIIGGYRKDHGNTNKIWQTENGVEWNIFNCSPISPTHATSIFSTPGGIVIAAGNGWSKEIWKISKIYR